MRQPRLINKDSHHTTCFHTVHVEAKRRPHLELRVPGGVLPPSIDVLKEHLSFDLLRKVCEGTADCGRVNQAARHQPGARTLLVSDRNCATSQDRDHNNGHDNYAYFRTLR